ncbi:MAG TPA: helix-turn-helix domain-containing protein [Burkholderiales bacterium]
MTAQALLTTNAAPAHERVGYWGDLVQRSFGRLRSRTYGDERFHGEIRRFQLGELRLSRLEASRHAVERTTGAAGASDPGDLKMVVQRRGCSVFEQGERLREPGLDIEAIAGALQCSKHALHKAFEDRGDTLHRSLWHSRLELARRQIEDPREAARSITSILLGAGFSSAAHFSLLFRQRYGASPREWRARAAAVRSAT